MTEKKSTTWFKKVGLIGFLFFFAKGMAWLAAAGAAALFLK